MFLAERLIGISIYAYFLLMFFLLIYASNINVKGLLAAYTLVLAAMGFCFKPYVTADLYRIYESVRLFATFSFSDFWHELVVTASTPAARLFYYAIGKTGIPELLPAITCLVTYTCIFYIILHTAERFSISRKHVAIAVLFTMSVGNYMMVISNIRSMLAISLICWCFFRESVEKKYSIFHLPVYITAGLLHNLAIVVIVFRIMVLLFKKQISTGKKILLLFCGMLLCGIFSIGFPSLFVDVLEKAYEYLTEDMYSYSWEYLIGGMIYLIELWVLLNVKKISEPNRVIVDDMKNFLMLCLIVSGLFCFEFSIFFRIVTFIMPILGLPLMMILLKEKMTQTASGYRNVAQMQSMLISLSMVLLFLTCFRGSMTSLKFFVF